MANGKYATDLIAALWPYTVKKTGAMEWAIVASEIDNAPIDDDQVRAILEEMKKTEKYFDVPKLVEKVRAVTKRSAANKASTDDFRERQYRERAEQVRRVWLGTSETFHLHDKCNDTFQTYWRLAANMIPDWPLDQTLSDHEVLKLAIQYVNRAPQPKETVQ